MKPISIFRRLDLSEVSLTLARSKRPTFDFVVEAAGRVTILKLEHEQHEPPAPQIDWSRSFTQWNIKRERDAHYVFP